MSDPTLSTTSEPTSESEHSSTGMLIVRYGIGGIMVLGGIVMLILSPAGLGSTDSRWRWVEDSPFCCSTSCTA